MVYIVWDLLYLDGVDWLVGRRRVATRVGGLRGKCQCLLHWQAWKFNPASPVLQHNASRCSRALVERRQKLREVVAAAPPEGGSVFFCPLVGGQFGWWAARVGSATCGIGCPGPGAWRVWGGGVGHCATGFCSLGCAVCPITLKDTASTAAHDPNHSPSLTHPHTHHHSLAGYAVGPAGSAVRGRVDVMTPGQPLCGGGMEPPRIVSTAAEVEQAIKVALCRVGGRRQGGGWAETVCQVSELSRWRSAGWAPRRGRWWVGRGPGQWQEVRVAGPFGIAGSFADLIVGSTNCRWPAQGTHVAHL